MDNITFIIVPIYKAESYLHRCVDSFLSQPYKSWKLILVDDGSPDNCPIICDNYTKKDDRIVVIHQKNKGVSSARNAGLDYLFKKNKEGYVTFVDADDWVDKDYLKNLVEMLETNGVDIVCSSFNTVNGNNIKPYKHIDKEGVYGSLEATRLLLRDESIQSHSYSSLYKLSLWKDIRFNTDLFYMEDQETIYKAFYKAKNVYITNYAGYYYRQDNVNAVTKTTINNKKVISGLKGYYYPCLYNGFKKEDREYLLPSIHNALVAAYLSLIPHYKRRYASIKEREIIKEITKYMKNNKLVKNYVPNNKNNIIKKKMYLLSPYLYPLLFKVAKEIM